MKKDNRFKVSSDHSYNVEVAIKLGNIGKAVFLKELARSHEFFLNHGKHIINGFSWFFMRPDKVRNLYPEFAEKTIYRWTKELEKEGLIACRADLNVHKYDRTRWFTVNMHAYELMTRRASYNNSIWILKVNESKISQNENTFSQNDLLNSQNENSFSQNDLTIHSSIETSIKSFIEEKENLENSSLFPLPIINQSKKEDPEELKKEEAIEVVKYLNQMAGRKFPHDPKGRGSKNVDDALWLMNKGYSLEEIKLMIDMKCFEWKDNLKMKHNLKPITLFKRHGVRYCDEAIEARDNESIQKDIKSRKKVELKKEGKLEVTPSLMRRMERIKKYTA